MDGLTPPTPERPREAAMTRTMLLVGTRKGAFVLSDDGSRSRWTMSDPACEGWPIHDLSFDTSTGSVYAAGGSSWYGPAVWRSGDLGKSWTHSSEGITYGDDGEKIATIWNVTPAHGSIWAGVEPAGLFRSEDGGATWSHVEGLREHPSQPTWQPGGGGLICHTIVAHPTDPARMWVGISAVGTFATEDGGRTWEARNKGIRADFLPEPLPETGTCVHKLVMAAGEPDTLYQQNHCGVYRSFDAGCTWGEITAGLPSDFGFPMAAHPRDAATAWVIPLNGADRGRFVPDGSAAVWKTTDRGDTWTRHGQGLPQRDAYLGILREAMAVDRGDPVGVYFGTSTGQLYGSTDEGATWSLVADHLPPIWGVEAVTLH
jgi:photosystem II stability/assembly factor-like uncharacterized protein